MYESNASPSPLEYQNAILPRVSRTFALTIPQLPAQLRIVVGNAYLLCRLADTIEDDSGLAATDKQHLMRAFLEVVRDERDAERFAADLAPQLSDDTPESERELLAQTARVVAVTHALTPRQRRAVERCVTVMGIGMPEFQQSKSRDGLATMADLNRYCYVVAGIVGEMLTELFCDYCAELEPGRDEMMRLAVSFGQGLQMTNILKDIWEDAASGTCWLPQSAFPNVEGGIGDALRTRDAGALTDGIDSLVGVAHAHLRDALRYVVRIPKREAGIRRFCLWAIGMAVLTLQKIHRTPGYTAGAQVKISRRAVRLTIAACNSLQFSNRALDTLFSLSTAGLPLGDPGPAQPVAAQPRNLASDRATG